jgi:hypothetical protein
VAASNLLSLALLPAVAMAFLGECGRAPTTRAAKGRLADHPLAGPQAAFSARSSGVTNSRR